MAETVEMEIKLILEKSNQAKLLTQPLVKKALVAGSKKTLQLVSTYYDTRDYKLSNTGITYRLRKTGKAYEATVKTSGENIGGFSTRGEYTVPLTRKKVVLKGFGENFDKKLQTLLADDELQKLFDVAVTRTIYLLKITEATLVEMAVDQGEIRADGSLDLISEVEMEIKEGNKEDLFAFLAQLAGKLPMFIESRSKFKRGLDLLAGNQDDEPEPEPLPYLERSKNAESEYKKILQYALGAALVGQNMLRSTPEAAGPEVSLLPAWEDLKSLWAFAEPLIPQDNFTGFREEIFTAGLTMEKLALVHSCKQDWHNLEELNPMLRRSTLLTKKIQEREKALLKELTRDVKGGRFTALAFSLISYLATESWQSAAYLQLDQFIDYRLKTWKQELAAIEPEDAGKSVEYIRQLCLVARGFLVLGKAVRTDKLTKATYKNIEHFYTRLTNLLKDMEAEQGLESLCEGSTSKEIYRDAGILQGYRLAQEVKTWDRVLKYREKLKKK